MEPNLIIIDGNSILYREFFALPASLRNRNGDPTNAVYGYANIMTKIFTELKPTHMVVAFDVSKKTFRNDLYSEYKANRKPMPDDLRAQIEPVKGMLRLMHVPVIEREGLEGDDVVGSVAKKFKVKTAIITGDRDTFQLIDDTTTVLLNKRGITDVKVVDEAELFEMYGLKPNQMVYLKALMGDSSDNIPGVAGIGEKIALSLVKEFGSLEGIYASLDKIKPAVAAKLQAGKEMAELSLALGTINTNLPLDITLDDLRVSFPYDAKVKEFFEFNNFRSLTAREELYGEAEARQIVEASTVAEAEITIGGLTKVQKEITKAKLFALEVLDEEATLAVGEKAYRIKFSPLLGEREQVLKALAPIFEDKEIVKVVFDAKALMHQLADGARLENYFDAMLAAHLCYGIIIRTAEDMLDSVGKNWSNHAYALLQSYPELKKEMAEIKVDSLYQKVELPLVRVLYEMEKQGFKVDVDKLDDLARKYNKELLVLEKQIYQEAGYKFNINSPKQMAELIYDKLHLSKSRKKSTGAEVLEKLADRHPIVNMLIRYRKVYKFLSSFIYGLEKHIDGDYLVHTTFNQTLTATGRLSSSDPNLQNIPVRGEESRELRAMFVASAEDRVLVDADYSQIELRLLAHFSGDDLLCEAFAKNIDIHTQTACAIFGVTPDMVTSEMRRKAKVVNFGVNYGISEFGLAEDLKVPLYEAKQYIESYYLAHPKIKEFMEASIAKAKETGRVATLLGRTRRMIDIGSSNYQIRSRAERASQNMPLQGTAADIIKLAMTKVYDRLKVENPDAKLIMQVHDELIVDCKKGDADKVEKIVVDEMKNAVQLSVPLEVDCSVAYRWSDGH